MDAVCKKARFYIVPKFGRLCQAVLNDPEMTQFEMYRGKCMYEGHQKSMKKNAETISAYISAESRKSMVVAHNLNKMSLPRNNLPSAYVPGPLDKKVDLLEWNMLNFHFLLGCHHNAYQGIVKATVIDNFYLDHNDLSPFAKKQGMVIIDMNWTPAVEHSEYAVKWATPSYCAGRRKFRGLTTSHSMMLNYRLNKY